jgi:hypothetical protein
MALTLTAVLIAAPNVGRWLRFILDMPPGAPAKDDVYGVLWAITIGLILGLVAIVGYLLGWFVNALIYRIFFGWPWRRVSSVILQSEVPSEWLAKDTSTVRKSDWAEVRLKGRGHFILTTGILRWGLWMYVIMSVVPALGSAYLGGRTPSAFTLLWQAALWACGGALFGVLLWYFSERHFRRNAEQRRRQFETSG